MLYIPYLKQTTAQFHDILILNSNMAHDQCLVWYQNYLFIVAHDQSLVWYQNYLLIVAHDQCLVW